LQGEQGPQGERGMTGERGDIGPTGERGLQGERGEQGEQGLPGDRGERGEKGDTGVGLAAAVIDRNGGLVITMSDGSVAHLGPVIGRDGKDGAKGADGKDGKDGLGFEDLEIVYDGERTFAFKLQRGDQIKKFEFDVPITLYRGVFKEGNEYHRGDVVTFGGSTWHCNNHTKDKPGETIKAWTLQTKRGRDGKDGAPGPKGEKGATGANGRDLTVLGGR
jgi:integrin beta 3